MEMIIDVLSGLPDYIVTFWSSHQIPVIIAAVFFIFVAFFHTKVAKILRYIFVIAMIALIGYAALQIAFGSKTAANKRSFIAVILITLLLLAIFRLIAFALHSIRVKHTNRRIEERALAKAARRRGSWPAKQGRSGRVTASDENSAKSTEEKRSSGEESDEIADSPEATPTIPPDDDGLM